MTGSAAPAATDRCDVGMSPGKPDDLVILRLRDVGRSFGRRRIFAGLDVDVPRGMRLLLAGGNGSGKTTLLRCLAGMLALTSGEATVGGLPVGSLAARGQVGICPAAEGGLWDNLTAHENLMFVARLRLPWRRVASAVSRVGRELEIGSYATVPLHRCSTGMRTRVNIARALIGEPTVVLLDEPSRSLDQVGHDLLWAALDRRPATACVLASHDDRDRARCDAALNLRVPC
jgi:ABC-2 type transport system ATP-binding protein